MNPYNTPISGESFASATDAGIIELATDAETATGTATDRAITPANLQSKTSSTTAKGIVELATDAETVTGTSDAVVTTPGNITAKMAAPGAIGGTTPAAGTFTELLGEVNVIPLAASTVLTAAQCKGSAIIVTGAYTMTLPIVTGFNGSIGGSVLVYSAGADIIHVDANAADRIVLDGVALDDGDKITSPGTAGAYVYLVNDTAVGWRVIGRYGTWTDGG